MNPTLLYTLALGMSDYGAENSWSCGESALWFIFVIVPVWAFVQSFMRRRLGRRR